MNVRLEVDSTVGKLAERSSLLELGSLLGVLRDQQKSVQFLLRANILLLIHDHSW